MKHLELTFPGIKKVYATSVSVPTGGIDKAKETISTFIEILLIVAVVLAILFTIKGGIDVIMSSGEKEKLKNGRRAVMFGILGLCAALLSFGLMKTITKAFLGN